MHLKVTHRTTYAYNGSARDSHNEVRLAPLTDEFQICHSCDVIVEPRVRVSSFMARGGQVHSFNVRPHHGVLEIVMKADVETLLTNPFDMLEGEYNDWSFYNPSELQRLYAEELAATGYVKRSEAAYQLSQEMRDATEGGSWDFIWYVKAALGSLLTFQTDVTTVFTDSDQVLEHRCGVCQDFAHLMLALLRCQGIPCRYVSGYLYNGETDHFRGDQVMHAWVECLLPNGKWIGIDPTNNILTGSHHIRVHVGIDYSEVTPTRGLYWGSPSDPPVVSVKVVEDKSPASGSQKRGAGDWSAVVSSESAV